MKRAIIIILITSLILISCKIILTNINRNQETEQIKRLEVTK